MEEKTAQGRTLISMASGYTRWAGHWLLAEASSNRLNPKQFKPHTPNQKKKKRKRKKDRLNDSVGGRMFDFRSFLDFQAYYTFAILQ